jgi:hypothetical protein
MQGNCAGGRQGSTTTTKINFVNAIYSFPQPLGLGHFDSSIGFRSMTVKIRLNVVIVIDPNMQLGLLSPPKKKNLPMYYVCMYIHYVRSKHQLPVEHKQDCFLPWRRGLVASPTVTEEMELWVVRLNPVSVKGDCFLI